jgi:biofilm protein TabA
MILDILENAYRYAGLHKGFAKAFEFLSRRDLKELEVGKYEIDSERVYGIVARELGRRKEEDAHMPLISSDNIHKVVVKVAV